MTRIGDIGTPAVVNFDRPLGYYVSLALLKPINIDSYFLSYLIQTRKVQKELWNRTIHVAFPKKINKEEVGECKAYIPSFDEQYRISNFLIKIDERIETQIKIIRDYVRLINVLNKRILKIELGKISDFIKIEKKTRHKSSDGLVNGDFPFFTNKEKQQTFYNTFDFDGEYIICNTGGRAGFNYFNGKFSAMSDCLVFTSNKTSVLGIYYFLKNQEKFINNNFFNGSGLKHLDKKQFFNMKIFGYDDISLKTLKCIDKKIEIEKKLLNKLINLKNYLLKNLFI